MSTFQLETLLSRRTLWAGSSMGHDEYVVGRYRTLRIRIRNNAMMDVQGNALTVLQIQSLTD
jgi:hypothetical protein